MNTYLRPLLAFAALFISAMILFSCSQDEERVGSDRIEVLTVASSKPSATIPGARYWVMDEGKFVWRLLKSDIKDFDFENGYESKISVFKGSDGKYRLKEVLNKEKKESVVPLMSYNLDEFGPSLFEGSDVSVDSIASTRGATLAFASKYWPNGDVYYVFDSNFADSTVVKRAMNIYQNNTGLRFFPGHGYGNYIKFGYSSESYNYSDGIGMLGGQQAINFVPNGFNTGTALHEIGHGIGLFHEQCRTDRDTYITILWNNIISNMTSQFTIRPYTRDISNFDFASIMLYSSQAFAKEDGLYTMVDKNNCPFGCQRFYLSNADIESVKSIYGPPFAILESEMEVVDEYVDAALDYYDTEVTYTIRICEDRNGLVSSSLSYPRDIRIKRVVETANSSSSSHEINTYYDNITLPAGTSTYTVGTYENIEHLRNGNPEEIRITTLTLQ